MRIAAIALLLAATPAAAQTVVQEPDRVVVRKTTIVDFNAATIDGIPVRPEGSYTLVSPRPGFPSLIHLRKDFLPELQKSADRM